MRLHPVKLEPQPDRSIVVKSQFYGVISGTQIEPIASVARTRSLEIVFDKQILRSCNDPWVGPPSCFAEHWPRPADVGFGVHAVNHILSCWKKPPWWGHP